MSAHGLVQTWAQLLTHVWGGCVVHRCQNKNPRTRGCEWRHAPKACAEDFWGIWKKSFELRTRLRAERVDFWGSSRRICALRAPHVLGAGGDGKASRETLNSKVIKGFVPELRSRYVFFVFRDYYVLCVYVVNILCTFHTSVSGYGIFRAGVIFWGLWHEGWCMIKKQRNENRKHIFSIVGARSIIFTQPLRSGKIWHKVNDFKRSLTGLNSEFSFS